MTFGVISKRASPYTRSPGFSPVYEFYSFSFHFAFEFIFPKGIRSMSRVIFFACRCLVVPVLFVEFTFFFF